MKLRIIFLLIFAIVNLPFSIIAETPPSNEIYLPFPIENTETKQLEILDTKDSEKTANPENSLQQNPKVTSNKDTSSIGKDVNPLGKDPLNDKPSSIQSNKQTTQNAENNSKNLLNSNTPKATETKKKKKSKGDEVDPSEPAFVRGKSLLTRNQKKSAETEFTDSASKEGNKTNSSRTENANLFGLDGRNTEASGLVEKIEDPDAKIKAQFELARSLDRMGQPESEEKAYREYLKLISSFPVHPELTPRTHLAIAVLLFRRQEYRPALHHLVKLMKEFKSAKEFSPAHYYAGRIYESVWKDRDLERAKNYYDLYLKTSDGIEITPGDNFRKDALERRRLIESPMGI